jgi:transposase
MLHAISAALIVPQPSEFNRSLQHRSDVRCCNMSLKQEWIDKQARFWVLMAGGSTLTAACEAAGVNRESGCRWRQATGGRIPRNQPVAWGRYLSLEERSQIADLHLGGAGVRAIAVVIGRSPATVNRGLRRNGSAPTPRRPGKYAAQKQAELRGRRPKASKFDHPELADVVQSKLCVNWRLSRSASTSPRGFPNGRRCGCVPRRSTRRYTSKAEAICALTCTDTCVPAVPCGAREGPRVRNGARPRTSS